MRSAAKYIWIAVFVSFIGGFLLYETSGLMGSAPATASTAVASVNGREIPYLTYLNAVQRLDQQQSERLGRALTMDERQQLEDQAFDQLVSEILLENEYRRRGIRVSDDEIVEAARSSPPPELAQSPELQTDGRFDPEKYQRFLSSPAAKQQGLLYSLESIYRAEIPRQKLFAQLASDVYVTDERLWSAWKDSHDSAQITYVAFTPEAAANTAVAISDDEVRAYYDAHKKDLERKGRAVLSLLTIPRVITAADSAAVRARALALRDEILKGANFQDVAKRESADSVSAADGGSLGRGGPGRFVPEFEKAAYQLKTGQISEPVRTSFGYHLIRVDERKGDTLALRHILLRIQQSDSSAARTDRTADELSRRAAAAEQPAKFDSAARALGLTAERVVVFEGAPLSRNGRVVPSVSAWAFSGPKVGETSDLLDADDAYYLARLDTLDQGGVPTREQAQRNIRLILTRQKQIDKLLPEARRVAEAAAGSTLDQAAQARGLKTAQTKMFTRESGAPGVGTLNRVVGAAFGLPVGAVSAPIRTETGVYVIRVDRRVEADRAAWEAQKKAQREAALPALRQQRVRGYIEALRSAAKIEDNRKEIEAASRRATT